MHQQTAEQASGSVSVAESIDSFVHSSTCSEWAEATQPASQLFRLVVHDDRDIHYYTRCLHSTKHTRYWQHRRVQPACRRLTHSPSSVFSHHSADDDLPQSLAENVAQLLAAGRPYRQPINDIKLADNCRRGVIAARDEHPSTTRSINFARTPHVRNARFVIHDRIV